MAFKTIKQSISIKASPHDVYEALLDSKTHARFTGEPAKMSKKEGGKFMAYGDYIEGKNLHVVKDRKIVQEWRAKDWPKDHYSIAEFDLLPSEKGTRITLTQTGVPANKYRAIKQGWIDFYWKPLREFFGE